MGESTEAGREDFSGVDVGGSSAKVSGPYVIKRRVAVTHEFAPKLKKNWRKAKQTIKAGLLKEWNFPARMATELGCELREIATQQI